jgi:ATP-dependent helicase/nuclease subunit A
VHGAKGLEAETVLLLDTDSGAPKAETMGVLIDWPGEAPAPRRFVFLEREKSPSVCTEDLLLAEQKARSLEEINALYVALTRAEKRLVISSFAPHRKGERASWWERLMPLGQLADVPAEVAATESVAGAPFVLAGLPPRTVAPSSQMPAATPPTVELPENDLRTRMGLAMHRLLQWHPTQTGFEWTDVHTLAVAREFALGHTEAEEALAMAQRVVSGEGAWAWDASQLRQWGNEVEMVGQGVGLRLDRLVLSQAGDWWVIDFKSHETPEQRPELLAQIQQYGAAVALAQPGASVRLAFINALGQWREVSFS